MPNRVSDDLMAPCPFCAREVDKELVVYGGKCPHCFGEIPGEEAPTDPGEERRLAEQAAAKKKVERTKRLPLLIGGLLLMVPIASAVALVALRGEKPMPALNLDLAEYDMADVGQLVAYVEPEEPKEATQKGTKKPKQSTSAADLSKIGEGLLGSGDAAPQVDIKGPGDSSSGTAKVGPRGPKDTTGGGPDAMPDIRPSAGPGSADLEVDFGVQRRRQTGVVLTDDNQIIEMVKQTVTAELPKLRYQCYERRLKQDEAVQGSWTLEFTVKGDGTVGEAAAKGKGVSDGPLEACIVEKVQAWSFQPIKAPLPVSKTVTFRPS